jgi:hypothetical protein
MSEPFSLESFDVDGAIQETAANVDTHTRGAFLRHAGVGIGAVAGGGALLGALPSMAAAATPASDVAILNFALTLEYLESSFYAEASMKGALTGESKTFATVVAGHEAAHVALLKSALGSSAIAEPKFDFKGTTSNQAMFLATAEVLEYTGVHAYLGQVGNIKSKAVLSAAGSILPVEAWHAAWVADLRRHGAKPYPAPTPFATGLTKAEVLSAVTATGFIVAA